jgi:signal transduction histidine kinase/ligand-binding sensor domain-containing protein
MVQRPLQLVAEKCAAWVIGMLACAMLWTGAVWALDESPAAPGYYRKAWTPDSGAPSVIRAIAQAPEGFLWLGSDTGLYRFDGLSFERFEPPLDPELPVGKVSALAMEADGALWLGIEGSEVLRLERGQIVFRQTLPGSTGSIEKILLGPNGQRLLMSTNGLMTFSGKAWTVDSAPELPRGIRFYDAYLSEDGGQWIATDSGIFRRHNPESRFERQFESPPGFGQFAHEHTGTVWYCGEKSGLVEFAAVGRSSRSNASFPCYWISIDNRGKAWTDGSDGAGIAPVEQWLGKSSSEIKASLVKGVFGDEFVSAYFQDKEGSVWLGLANGLRQFRPYRLQRISLAEESGGIAAAKGGGFWLIGYRRGLMHVGEALDSFPDAGTALTYVSRDRRGVVWAGGHQRDVLLRIEGRDINKITFPPGSKDVFVNGISVQADGSPWVFTHPAPIGSVYHYVGERWLERGGVSGLPEGPANAVFVDAADRVWISYPGSRLFVVTDGKASAVPGAPELGLGNLRSIAEFGDDLVVAGKVGIAVLRSGKFQRISLLPPARFLGIINILQTRDGDFWVNQANSLLRLPAEQLRLAIERNEPVTAEVFDFRDGRNGTPISVAPHPTLAQMEDGRLLVSAGDISALDPAHISRNQIKPTVGFRFLSINGRKQHLDSRTIELSPDTEELVIGYMSSSIALPERVQFRYRLEGLDSRWREGNPQREATFNQLRPGEYTFRILASNNDGLWSEPATVRILVPPPYYETVWFALLCLTLFFVLVGLMVRARIRWVAERIRDRLQERSRERERIARELHDTLLQGIQGLILQFHLVADDLPADDANRKLMESALDRADRLMSEGRQRVSDLRLQEVGASLGASLHRQLLDGDLPACPKFRVRECGPPRVLAPMVQTELLRIAHEAVANALQHGSCNRLWLVVRYDRHALRVRIKDDGCGISNEEINHRKPGHWGITGMQERAKSIGAKLTVEPGKRRGTVVDITVPAGMAYANHMRRRWRRALWR